MDTLFTDLDNEIAKLFNSYRDNFCTQIELVPNKKRYFEIEIGSYHSRRFDEKKSHGAFFDNGISLSEYYNIAWDLAEQALENKIPNNVYLWGRNTLAIINDKYSENAPPSDYFARLNKVAIEEYIEGAANCWFYYWLVRELKELENPTSKPIESKEAKIIYKLSNKAKVLVLKELGFFDLPKIEGLHDTEKGILLNAICGGSVDNFNDYVGNFYNRDPKDTKNPNTKEAVEQKNKLLIGIKIEPK